MFWLIAGIEEWRSPLVLWLLSSTIFNVNPQQLVDEECEYVNFIEAASQEEFNKKCFFDPFETLPINSIASNELKLDVKLSDFSSLLNSSQMLEK